MPSTATITAFYTFAAGTKARATQVNGNFDIFRGHIIPVDPNTTTAINNTYDLGSSEYRWRVGYFDTISRTQDIGSITADAGKFAISNFSASGVLGNTSTGTVIVGSSITISTYGRPIEIGVCQTMPNAAQDAAFTIAATTTTGTIGYISLLANGTTVATYSIFAPANGANYYPVSVLRWVYPAAAGTYVFHLTQRNSGFANSFLLSQSSLYAIEK